MWKRISWADSLHGWVVKGGRLVVWRVPVWLTVPHTSGLWITCPRQGRAPVGGEAAIQ